MPLSVRDAGVWKDGAPWVRDAGTWKEVQQAWVRDAGVWKEFYTLLPLGTAMEGGYYMGTNIIGGVAYRLILAPRAGEGTAPYKSTGTPGGGPSATDGYTNTEVSMTSGAFLAATACRTYTAGGYTDWYLPSEAELRTAILNRASLPSGQEFIGTGDFMWSSTITSSDATKARLIQLASGTAIDFAADSPGFGYRPMRRVAA